MQYDVSKVKVNDGFILKISELNLFVLLATTHEGQTYIYQAWLEGLREWLFLLLDQQSGS